ncbi:hypothetical protein Tco_0748139 [Tanacetum coccineum]|uniref:Uncharacterized protein n=1 Tax=Tanacetum coccineum TaxID=301880 RepID=A0ABQ4YUY4_9ASTR
MAGEGCALHHRKASPSNAASVFEMFSTLGMENTPCRTWNGFCSGGGVVVEVLMLYQCLCYARGKHADAVRDSEVWIQEDTSFTHPPPLRPGVTVAFWLPNLLGLVQTVIRQLPFGFSNLLPCIQDIFNSGEALIPLARVELLTICRRNPWTLVGEFFGALHVSWLNKAFPIVLKERRDWFYIYGIHTRSMKLLFSVELLAANFQIAFYFIIGLLDPQFCVDKEDVFSLVEAA